MKYLVATMALLAFLISCSTARNRQVAPDLSGEWRNTYLKVVMPTYRNADTTRVLEANEQTWEQVLKIKAIRTFFRPDGAYNSEHRNLKDSIVYNPFGVWSIKGDSLYMTDTSPKPGTTYSYKFRLEGNKVNFTGLMDFDQDGKADDSYYGEQRRQK